MSDHRFTDETATVIVLNSLVRDMKHALDWLAGGLLALAIYFTIETFGDFLDHAWGALTFHAVLAAWGAWSYLDTTRRARKYRAGARR